MSLVFEPESHTYKSADLSDKTKWISVTTLLGNLKQPFDAKNIAHKSAKNKKSKWYGLTPDEIQQIWKNEAKRATDLGSWLFSTLLQRDIHNTGAGLRTDNFSKLSIFISRFNTQHI